MMIMMRLVLAKMIYVIARKCGLLKLFSFWSGPQWSGPPGYLKWYSPKNENTQLQLAIT